MPLRSRRDIKTTCSSTESRVALVPHLDVQATAWCLPSRPRLPSTQLCSPQPHCRPRPCCMLLLLQVIVHMKNYKVHVFVLLNQMCLLFSVSKS